MASRKAPPVPAARGPTMAPSKALPRLREAVDMATALLADSNLLTDEDYASWRTETRHWLEGAFGEGDRKVSAVMNAGSQRIRDSHWSARDLSQYLKSLLSASRAQLNTVIGLLEHEAADEAEAAAAPATSAARASSKKVFIVHGHDEAAKLAVARFVSKLKLEDVILHEQPNRGKTLIEKFEANAADIAYAVVLLTPDDRGGTAVAKYDEQHPRARQNVVFELGFFIGALGRERVCALHKPGTELPSDISGVVYISMDPNDGWKLQLAKEIKQVIPSVDMNDAM